MAVTLRSQERLGLSEQDHERLAKSLGLPPGATVLGNGWENRGESFGEGLVSRRDAEGGIDAALEAMTRAPHPADKALLTGLLESGTAAWCGREEEVRAALAKR